jgi:septal ring factor EnvC (AmiA/AmiB activator)
MSESEHATGAHGVDNSPISVVERRLDTINRDLMELNKERIRFLSDKTKNEDQIAALNEQITELKAEKEKKEAKLEELLAPAPAGSFFCLCL